MLIDMWAATSWLRLNWLKIFIIIIIAIAAVAGVSAWRSKSHGGKAAPSFLTPEVQASSQSKATQNWLSQKNYQNAAITCSAEASAQTGERNYSAAKTTLQNCITAIPDDQRPYFLYDSLSNVAKKLGDKSLQKASIQKALAKAQEPNSGADPALITFYNQELAILK